MLHFILYHLILKFIVKTCKIMILFFESCITKLFETMCCTYLIVNQVYHFYINLIAYYPMLVVYICMFTVH